MYETHEHTYPAADGPGDLPIWAVLKHLQEIAGDHAQLLGQGRDVMLTRYNAAWMIVRAHLHFEAPPDAGLPLTIRTWSRGLCRAMVCRDFDLIQNGRVIGEAIQAWVMADVTERKLCNMAKMPEIVNTARPAQVKALKPGKPACHHELTAHAPLVPGPEDLDVNGHVNNAAYLRLVLQALPHPLTTLQHLEISYSRECFAGELMPLLAWQEGRACYVRCLTPEQLPAIDLYAEAFDDCEYGGTNP